MDEDYTIATKYGNKINIIAEENKEEKSPTYIIAIHSTERLALRHTHASDYVPERGDTRISRRQLAEYRNIPGYWYIDELNYILPLYVGRNTRADWDMATITLSLTKKYMRIYDRVTHLFYILVVDKQGFCKFDTLYTFG